MTTLRHTLGFTLVEIMIVIAIMSVIVGLAVPYYQPNMSTQLQATAEIVASDIAFARSMAVSRGSEYTMTFDLAGQTYVLTHSGAAAALENLPGSPFHYNDTSTERTTRLDELPRWGQAVQIAAVLASPDSGLPTSVTDVEFTSLGSTTRSDTTVVWLQIGEGSSRIYVPIEIDPVTGLETVGEVTNVGPLAVSASIN